MFEEVEALGGMARKTLTSVVEFDAGPRLVGEDEPRALPAASVSEDSLPF